MLSLFQARRKLMKQLMLIKIGKEFVNAYYFKQLKTYLQVRSPSDRFSTKPKH